MTISQAYKYGINKLSSTGLENFKSDALILLCSVLNCDKVYVHTHPDNEIAPETEILFKTAIDKRSKNTPVQHITGLQEFMSLPFIVSGDVLIPRHDTEILVETALNIVNLETDSATNTNPIPFRILDIGTGSGCIAISLAKYLSLKKDFSFEIFAIDISEKALEIAKKNAVLNKVEDFITFKTSNIFDDLSGLRFNMIVSNPPYIPHEDENILMSEVKDFEPSLALFGGETGFEFYEKIIPSSINHLYDNGYLLFEVGINQFMHIKALMDPYFNLTNYASDLSGIERVVYGKL